MTDLDKRRQRQVIAFDTAIARIVGARSQHIRSAHYRHHGGRCYIPGTGDWFTVPADAGTRRDSLRGLYCVPGWL
jgi:hypothetical protein